MANVGVAGEVVRIGFAARYWMSWAGRGPVAPPGIGEAFIGLWGAVLMPGHPTLFLDDTWNARRFEPGWVSALYRMLEEHRFLNVNAGWCVDVTQAPEVVDLKVTAGDVLTWRLGEGGDVLDRVRIVLPPPPDRFPPDTSLNIDGDVLSEFLDNLNDLFLAAETPDMLPELKLVYDKWDGQFSTSAPLIHTLLETRQRLWETTDILIELDNAMRLAGLKPDPVSAMDHAATQTKIQTSFMDDYQQTRNRKCLDDAVAHIAHWILETSPKPALQLAEPRICGDLWPSIQKPATITPKPGMVQILP